MGNGLDLLVWAKAVIVMKTRRGWQAFPVCPDVFGG